MSAVKAALEAAFKAGEQWDYSGLGYTASAPDFDAWLAANPQAAELTAMVQKYERAITAVAVLHFQYRGPAPVDSCAECSRIAGWHVPYDKCTTRAALRTPA